MLRGRRKNSQKMTFLMKLFIKFKTAKLNNMLGYNMYKIMLFLKEKMHFTFFRSLNLHVSLW